MGKVCRLELARSTVGSKLRNCEEFAVTFLGAAQAKEVA
jgi:hypothetical protein